MTTLSGFKGKAKRIEDVDLPRIGRSIGVGEDEIHAVLDVESSGKGFDSKGRPKMLFEPHIFWKELPPKERELAAKQGLAYPKWKKSYPKDSYPRLEKAMKINENAALRSCSWGLGQIMGFNCTLAGYDSAKSMVLDFMDDEDNHLEAMIEFIKTAKLDDELRRHDWAGFARGYNGLGFAKNKYDKKLAERFAHWQKIKDTAWTPARDVERVFDDKSQLMHVQQKLKELGYHEVGKADGKMGSRTRGAILAFRADNGLELTPKIDKDLLAALMTAGEREVSEERKSASVSELRKEGSETISGADAAQATGAVTVAAGGLAKAKEALDTYSENSEAVKEAVGFINPVTDFIQSNVVLILIAVGLVAVYFAWKVKKARVRDHQEGRNLGR
jgi:hypothetical protein